MKQLTSILVTLLLLAGCTTNEPTSNQAKAGSLTTTDTSKLVIAERKDTTIALEKFITVPDTIGGCGEYLTYDTSQFTKDNYIFLSNLSAFAIIKINGNTIYLNKDTANSKAINNKSYTAVYQGQGYKVVLTMQQTKAYDEGGFYAGIVQVTGNKINAIFKVHGEAGC